jgi:hypothetical protein
MRRKIRKLLPAIIFMSLLAVLSIGVAVSTWMAYPHGLGQ